MKVIITGGSGFIGSHLADFLIDSDYEVVVVDNLSIGRLENISNLLSHSKFTFLQADITDFDAIESVFKGADWVFHLAVELAGLPLHVFGEISNYEQLNIDADVCSDLLIKHKTGAISQIHLDYLQTPAHRSGTISFTQGWMSYDFNRSELVAQLEGEPPVTIWSDSKYDFNQMYIKQMQEFIRYVEEGRMRHKFDLPSSIEGLKVVEALFVSNKRGAKVEIERNERFSF